MRKPARKSRATRTYRDVWGWVAAFVASTGLILALVHSNGAQLFALAVTGFTLGLCAGCLNDVVRDQISLRSVMTFGGVCGIGVLVIAGFSALFDGLGVFVPLAVAAGWPWFLAGARRQLVKHLQRSLDQRAHSETESVPTTSAELPTTPPPDVLEQMDTPGLCQAWQASSAALSRVSSVEQYICLSQRRQSYLDELERRDPGRFTAWMESRPGADADPAHFFAGPARRPRPDPGS